MANTGGQPTRLDVWTLTLTRPRPNSVALNIGGSVHDPTDPVGGLLFNVLGMIAGFESDLIRMRTREGMKLAKAKGRLRGNSNPPKRPTWSDSGAHASRARVHLRARHLEKNHGPPSWTGGGGAWPGIVHSMPPARPGASDVLMKEEVEARGEGFLLSAAVVEGGISRPCGARVCGPRRGTDTSCRLPGHCADPRGRLGSGVM